MEQFQNNYGEPPSHLSAQAYDAAGIIFKSIISGADNRLKLRDSLIMVNNYPGVTGKTNLLESGDSEKNIFALTVRKKKIVEENLSYLLLKGLCRSLCLYDKWLFFFWKEVL